MKALISTAMLFTVLLATVSLSLGQTPPAAATTAPPDKDWETRVFPIQHVEPANLMRLLEAFGVVVRVDTGLRAVAIRGPKEVLPAIADVIRRFDVPTSKPRSVSITAYLVLASSQDGETAAIPAALRPVIQQLQNVLTYKSYRVLDTALARGVEGQAIQTAGVLEKLNPADPMNPSFSLTMTPRFYLDASGKETVRLNNMVLAIEVVSFSKDSPTPIQPKNLRIATDVDIQPGQQIVVGKTTLADRAFILVISAATN